MRMPRQTIYFRLVSHFSTPDITKDTGCDMARKTVSIKAKRAEAEAAEARGTTAKKTKKSAADKPAKVKKEKAVKVPKEKKPPRRKVAKEVRMKAYWGVFTQSWKRVAMFEYADKKAAEKKAGELIASSKAHHIVQLVKEPIAE
jgi:hypothetical protein